MIGQLHLANIFGTFQAWFVIGVEKSFPSQEYASLPRFSRWDVGKFLDKLTD